MAKTKLNQVIAVVSGQKSECEKALTEVYQSFDAAFVTFAVSVVLSSVLCWWLPKIESARGPLTIVADEQ